MTVYKYGIGTKVVFKGQVKEVISRFTDPSRNKFYLIENVGEPQPERYLLPA